MLVKDARGCSYLGFLFYTVPCVWYVTVPLAAQLLERVTEGKELDVRFLSLDSQMWVWEVAPVLGVRWAGEGAARTDPPWPVSTCPAVWCDSASQGTVRGSW